MGLGFTGRKYLCTAGWLTQVSTPSCPQVKAKGGLSHLKSPSVVVFEWFTDFHGQKNEWGLLPGPIPDLTLETLPGRHR